MTPAFQNEIEAETILPTENIDRKQIYGATEDIYCDHLLAD